MANTKTIKQIKIAKTKCENLNDFLLNFVHWEEIAKVLNYSKPSVFRIKKAVEEIYNYRGRTRSVI
ncbi:hypothetical protein ACO2FJ_12590 [Staphylococcus warneri]